MGGKKPKKREAQKWEAKLIIKNEGLPVLVVSCQSNDSDFLKFALMKAIFENRKRVV